MNSDMETHSAILPSGSAALDELDPAVQNKLFQRIEQQVAQQLRETLANLPRSGILGTGSLNPPAGPSHAAGSQAELDALNQPTPTPLAEVNFNWGSTVPSDDQGEVGVSIIINNSQGFNSPLYHDNKQLETIPKGFISNIREKPKLKRKRTSSDGPTNGTIHECEENIRPLHKKIKIVNGSPCKNLKQTKLSRFFFTHNDGIVNTTQPKGGVINNEKNKLRVNDINDLDRENLTHLIALDSYGEGFTPTPNEAAPTAEQSKSFTETIKNDQTNDIINRTKQRESILFRNTNPIDDFTILDSNGGVDDQKLSKLMQEIEEHNKKLYNLSMIRSRQQLDKIQREAQGASPNVLDKISSTLTKSEHKNKHESLNPKVSLHKTNNCFSYSKQEGESAMTDSALSTWNKSRTAAVDASKANTRAKFYKEAPKKNLLEYWTYGLEKTPGYLMKLPGFRKSLQEMRIRHARDIMNLAAEHLEKEVARNNGSAASIKAAAIKQVYETNPPDVAQRIIASANVSYDITISNMSNNEFKDLERRRQALERAPPSAGDILDPAANVARNTARETSSSSGNNQSSNRGFPQRGRGRGGSRPSRSWRNQRGRKPYERK